MPHNPAADNPAVAAYWARYLATLPPDADRPTAFTAWYFCDNEADANELGELVRQGTKTATCSLLWEYEADGEPLPAAGDLSVVTAWDGQPLCIIRTTEVTVQPFDAVDAQFAYDEGEGDRSYAYWRAAHWRFFSRACAQIGHPVSEEMPVVCERFRVVFAG